MILSFHGKPLASGQELVDINRVQFILTLKNFKNGKSSHDGITPIFRQIGKLKLSIGFRRARTSQFLEFFLSNSELYYIDMIKYLPPQLLAFHEMPKSLNLPQDLSLSSIVLNPLPARREKMTIVIFAAQLVFWRHFSSSLVCRFFKKHLFPTTMIMKRNAATS